jgi:hypothetical protein
MSGVKRVRIIIPDQSVIDARQKAEDARAAIDSAVKIQYIVAADRFALSMRSGILLSIPRACIGEFDGIDRVSLARVKVGIGGGVIELASHDIDIYLPGLLRDILGLNAGQRAGGLSRSSAKSEAARRNGTLGGRPKKSLSGR